MTDLDRLVLMTKFAIYDKKTGEKDRKINEYFLDDFVYHKNWLTRLYVFFGCVIVLFFYWLHKIVIERFDIFSMDFKTAFIGNLMFIGVVMVIYTLIGTWKATREYRRAQKRLKRYFTLLNKLDRDAQAAYAGEAADDGADFDD